MGLWDIYIGNGEISHASMLIIIMLFWLWKAVNLYIRKLVTLKIGNELKILDVFWFYKQKKKKNRYT